MSRLTITVEYPDGRVSPIRSGLHPEEVTRHLRSLGFRVASGEFAGVYITREKPLDVTTLTRQPVPPDCVGAPT